MDNRNEIIEIHERLLVERRTRFTLLSLLLSALVFTIIYGTLQDPFDYTFSKIGNRFEAILRVVFIVWSIYTGLAIQLSIIALFRLEGYKNKWGYRSIYIAVIFLVLTAIIPSIDKWAFLQDLHILAGVVFALFLTIGFIPFCRWVARENPRLRQAVYVWITVIWIGSLSLFRFVGNTGIFELFFFSTFIVFLMYITLSLFEEQIIKRSIILLHGHEDINRGIDEIFFPDFVRLKRKRRLMKLRKKKKGF